MNKRQAVPYGLVLIAFLLWIYVKPQEESITPVEHHPSYIAYHLENTRFDEFGDLTLKIYAAKATNYTDKDMTLFKGLKVVLYIANQEENSTTIWQASSDNGILTGNNNKLILSNNVWVKNLSLDQLIQTMNTEKLTILLAEKELSSDSLVKWQGPQMTQQGIGMWASLVSEELIVKKQVKAIYLNENK